jgi:hypothetical protein
MFGSLRRGRGGQAGICRDTKPLAALLGRGPACRLEWDAGHLMDSPRVMNYQRLYRRTSITIDILCLVGIPLVLGIVINYVLAISVFAIIAVVTFFRRRFLDEKAEKLVLSVTPSLGYSDEQTASSQTDGRPIRIMVLAAALITAGAIVSLVIHLTSGPPFPIWLIGCVVAIWFGVAMTAVGQWLGRR